MNKEEAIATSHDSDDPSTSNHSIPSSLLEKLWGAYSTTDDRRRKTFYYLYSIMVVFSLLWITKEQQVPLPFFQTNVEIGMALSLAPALISILTIRYLYLCAYTKISYRTYVRFYHWAHQEDFTSMGVTFSRLYSLLKLRDLTDKLNLYEFPIRTFRGNDPQISFLFRLIVNFLLNIGIFLSVLIPISAYIVIIIWLGLQNGGLNATLVGKLLYSVYLMGIGLVFLPIHFYFIVRSANKRIETMVNNFKKAAKVE
jgi:hypothetical protein